MSQRTEEKQDLEKQIAIEQQSQIPISEQDILFFLTALKKGDANNEKYRRMLINVFLVAAYLYDDKLTYILTVGNKAVTVTESLLADIDKSNADYMGSCMSSSAPPNKAQTIYNRLGLIFCTIEKRQQHTLCMLLPFFILPNLLNWTTPTETCGAKWRITYPPTISASRHASQHLSGSTGIISVRRYSHKLDNLGRIVLPTLRSKDSQAGLCLQSRIEI